MLAETGKIGNITIVDGKKLGAMLIPIEQDAAGQWWYTCRHLQESGDCGAYASRPWTCREYPYGHKCRYEDCTWDWARALPERRVTA